MHQVLDFQCDFQESELKIHQEVLQQIESKTKLLIDRSAVAHGNVDEDTIVQPKEKAKAVARRLKKENKNKKQKKKKQKNKKKR